MIVLTLRLYHFSDPKLTIFRYGTHSSFSFFIYFHSEFRFDEIIFIHILIQGNKLLCIGT